MKRYAKFALWLVIATIAAFAAFRILFVVASWGPRKTAESLLRDIRSCKVGETTLADVKPILERYDWKRKRGYKWSKCAGPGYSIGMGTMAQFHELYDRMPWMMFWLGTWLTPQLVKAAPPSWSAGAMLDFDEEERLCKMEYSVRIVTPRYELIRWEVGEADPSEGNRFAERDHNPKMNPSVRWWSRSVEVTLTPQATAQERALAFDYDLSCLTSFAGCKKLCQVMPSAWRDAVVRLLRSNPNPYADDDPRRGDVDLNDSDCPATEASQAKDRL